MRDKSRAMPRKSNARRDAIATAARLFQRQGYHATGLNQILSESGAPKGSLYFHFPGGKEQLAAEAVALASRELEKLFEHAAGKSKTYRGFLAALAGGLASWMERSEFREGCPVSTVTLEMTPHNDALTEVCRTAFSTWQNRVAEFLASVGFAERRALRLATLIVCAFEGAFIVARAERSTRPFLETARELSELG